MAKFFGEVGFGELSETAPGVWENTIVKRNYKGELVQIARQYQTAEKINQDIMVNNEIHILGDEYAFNNFAYIKYVNWAGVNWIVNKVTVQYPRLILSLGGVSNDK